MAKLKLGDDVIVFLKELGISEDEWEYYLERNGHLIPTGNCTVKVDEIPEDLSFRYETQGSSKDIQNIVNQIRIKYGINAEMVLYKVNIFSDSRIDVKFIKPDDEDYNYFINNYDLISYELKYIREYNGMTDVIMYSKTRDISTSGTSFYTLDCDGNALVCSLKNRNWQQVSGMNDYVLLMFAAFREQGITFTNNTINEITDNFIKTRRPKSLERTKNIKE